MAPLLEKILNAKEISPFVLIKDTLEQSGQVLGLEILGASSPE
jgi:elongator complex protein 5